MSAGGVWDIVNSEQSWNFAKGQVSTTRIRNTCQRTCRFKLLAFGFGYQQESQLISGNSTGQTPGFGFEPGHDQCHIALLI